MAKTKRHTDSNALSLESHVAEIRGRVEQRLATLVPSEADPPQRLHRAMRYSLLAGGKRVRPVLTVLAATHLGGEEESALDTACAIEMVHTASLILDDLPSMDDARLRRGQPANHLVFGEDTALLAAMALLNQAYAVIGDARGLSPDLRLSLISLLSKAIGSDGIIAGQVRDLHDDWQRQDAQSLEGIHGQKTAALFVASGEAGARLACVPEDWLEYVRRFARNLGLAFQILDDLLDASSTDSAAGKDVGQDRHKATFVSFVGERRARLMTQRFVDAAVDALAPLAPASEPLALFAHSLTTQTAAAAVVNQAELAGRSR